MGSWAVGRVGGKLAEDSETHLLMLDRVLTKISDNSLYWHLISKAC